jgi:pimeloyl-ACP methyl ester carboxylesterase
LSLRGSNVFNAAGFDVLSINRVGYGGNPIPETAQPVLDSIPLYSALIKKAYNEHSIGKNGIFLVGHSLGAATALGIASFEAETLPILGVSALGIIPTKEHPAGLVDMLKADPENPRFVVEASPEAVEAFMGPPSVIGSSILVHPSLPKIFEPGKPCERISPLQIVNSSRPKV